MAALNEQSVIEIASLSKSSGRLRLMHCLNLEPFDDEIDLDKSIFLDYLYNYVRFCIDKHFPPSEVCLLFELIYEMINCTEWKEIEGALEVYRSKCEYLCQVMNSQHLQTFSEFFFSTFFQHYRLYQCVMTTVRNSIHTSLHFAVDVPPSDVAPIADSVDPEILQYQKELDSIETQEQLRRLERECTVSDDSSSCERKCNDFNSYVDHNLSIPIDREELADIVSAAVRSHLCTVSKQIDVNMETIVEDLCFKLRKAAIPRPLQLGPPPHSQMNIDHIPNRSRSVIASKQ